MSQWRPCKRNDFVCWLRQLGFNGLYSGAKHQFMVYENHRLTIPSNKEYSAPQLRMMVREVERIIGREILVDEWEALCKVLCHNLCCLIQSMVELNIKPEFWEAA